MCMQLCIFLTRYRIFPSDMKGKGSGKADIGLQLDLLIHRATRKGNGKGKNEHGKGKNDQRANAIEVVSSDEDPDVVIEVSSDEE